MTARQRDILNWLFAGGAASLVGAGVVYGATRAEIAGKLDANRFVTDSTRRDERQALQDERTAGRDSLLLREVRTVRLIICQDRPRDGWCLR